MSALLATRTQSLLDGLGGEPTLDDVLSSVWEGLTAQSVVTCPVCGSEMRPEYGQRTRVLRGRCTDCGATLT
jgi:ribosomal protein S27E